MKYFLYDKSQNYVTRINTEYMIESHYTEEINTAGQLEFTLPATMRLPQNVFFVCITDPDDETSYLMFKIITEKVTDEQVTYTCIENAYDELASYTYIQDKRPTAIASAMLQMALDGTRWSVGACPEVSPKFCSFYYISVLEAIQKIVNLWGFEVQFQVKIDGITNEIKQRNVNMYTKLGERTNKRFEYGSNLLSVTQANDSTGLYTALVGRGKGVQVSEGDTDTDPDGYGRRITFADVVWSTQSGNPLNKPAGQEYLEDPNATAAYGFPDGHPRIGFVVFQDCEDPNELIQLTYNKLQEVNHPQVQFSANIADVGSLNLGDTIAIIRHDIGIEYYTRVFKVVHDLLDSSNNTVELGDNIAGSNSITQQISTIKDNQSNVQNAIDTIVMNGADGNKLFFGTEFPENGTDGDIFYKTLENGGTEMYIYKDGGWQLVVSTEELDAVQKKVDEQTSQIQQAVDSANSAVSKADEAVAQVGTLDENVKSLDAESKQNQNDIAQAKSDLLQTKSDLDAAKANISATQADIQADKQSIQNLSAEAQKQGETITSVQNTQNALSASVADVKGNVTAIKVDLDGLKSVVQDNKGNISQLQQKADEISATVTSNTGDISQLKQTANSLQSSITDNSNNISSLNQTASGLQSSVTDANNNISQLKQQSGYIQSLVAAVNSDNLITNSDCLTNAQGVSPTTDWKPAWGWIYTDDNLVGRANWYGYSALQLNQISSSKFAASQAVQAGNPSSQTTYSVSLKYMLQKTDVRHWVNIQADYDQSFSNPKFYNIGDATQFDGNHWLTLTGTVTIPAETPWVRLCIGVEGDSGYIWIAQPMLVVGDKVPDSYISSNQPAQQMTSIKQSVDSIKSMAQDNQGNISQLQQTASSLQSVVSTKADSSQVTQLGNTIQSVVRSVGTIFPNGDFSSSDIQSFWQPWDTTHDYANINYDAATYNGSFGNLLLHASGGGWTKAISTEYIPVQPNKPVTVSLASRGDWYNSNGKPQILQCYVHFYDSKKNATENGHFDLNCSNNQQWYDNSTTYDCNSNECYIRIEIVLQGNQENWAHITNIKVSSDGGESISSKISQMADDINMRVQKGDLLSQINIQAGSTLIQSNKLYLDASSVVFSGNAFIPSAAITDLSADKITTGTLNAANVHVINMDVANLVGDTTSFVRSQWQNAYGSYVNIESSGMSIGYGNWFTKFDSNGIIFKDGGDDLGGFTRIGMQGAPGWYGGLAFNAGGDAEFLSIGAKDYHNDNQNPIPPKLLWMRQGIDTYGYNPGWNVLDDIWMNKAGMNSIQYGSWNIHFGIVVGSNNFSALTLTSGSGNGFYWGSDGSFGYVTGGNALHNVKGSQIVYSIGSDGICHSWGGV